MRDDSGGTTSAANETAIQDKLSSRLLGRLRTTKMSAILFQMANLSTYLLWSFPPVLQHWKTHSGSWLAKEIICILWVPIILAVSQRISIDNEADMVLRPKWFLLILTLGSIAAQIAVWMTEVAFGLLPSPITSGIPILRFFIGSLSIMILGGTFSWLSFLYTKSVEDQKKFGMLLMKRSVLARQIARTTLSNARAQIDPQMVVRVLCAVRVSYLEDPAKASALLDCLIGYLRLAMNRKREKNPSFNSEYKLLRSYLLLREAETGIHIELQIIENEWELQQPVAFPLFLIAQKLFEETVLAFAPHGTIRIEKQASQITMELDIGQVAISESGVTRLSAHLNQLCFDQAAILHRFYKSGGNRYVVQVAIE